MRLIALAALLLAGCAPVPTKVPVPLAAYAVFCQHGDNMELRGVIVQLDETHAVLSVGSATVIAAVVNGETKTAPIPPIPLSAMHDLGSKAKLKSGVVVDCGPPSVQTRS